ncbi:nonsense-mediated mRNA decay protein Upf3 [Blastomyces dermatitidis ER-3]|uniref:Nonsense-mediated mRNA decay protein Upf3 n=1 Tax=Ajellomyces dermatitidis (strain ER-3 / ATCC MYA-2586) TaxID=559297 RepID=A0ABP2EZ23_AJEDR|nr:nonsense-mediated mRNA decay protein Upf3 [Blastomyces dermatitidis ER-3]EEQ89552.1 nonsense-mediated mRNA decay protein Upf3 [Blastomyces dermatitidis ER-3]
MVRHSPKPSSAGVLPIPATATQKGTSNKPSSRAAAPRLKLLIRRLPPGLTPQEFEAVLGDEWKVGNGKVDWFHYKEGKVSKDPAKPSRPTRVYLRVTSIPLVEELSEKVRASAFQDARNTSRDPVVLGPPAVEYAPYPRVPSSRVRRDGRQGTIDLDSDFIAFLESLTNPVTKPAMDIGAEDTKEEKPTITPLIQFLKDKKANKGKEASSLTKPSRHGRGDAREGKDPKVERVHARKLLSRADKAAPSPGDRQWKLDRATKEAVKAVNKQTANQISKAPGKTIASRLPKEEPPAQTAPPAERRRVRGSMSAATKILRRDLGLAPTTPRRRPEKPAYGEGASSPPTSETAKGLAFSNGESGKRTSLKASRETELVRKPAITKSPKASSPSNTATGRNANNSTNAPASPGKLTTPPGPKHSSPTQASGKACPQPTATQAFLKHANPSQGVTEELLASGFSTFGKVVKVEIDKKKGFGYVDFAEPDGLAKAIQASPVQIAQSQVVVLERKSGAAVAQARGNASNRPNQPPGGGGPAPSRPTRRGNRGKGGFKKGGGGGNSGGSAAGGNKNASST